MGFNQTYSGIEKLWKNKVEKTMPVTGRKYFSRMMGKLKTAFQHQKYAQAKDITVGLYQFFERQIPNNRTGKLALAMAGCFWTLEGALEKYKRS